VDREDGPNGVGATLQLRAIDPNCAVRVERAVIIPDGETAHPAAPLPAGRIPLGRDPVYLYLPFPFDNLGTWKHGGRKGELIVTVAAADASTLPNARATTMRRPIYQWPSPTWQVDDWAYGRRAPKLPPGTVEVSQAGVPYSPRVSCAFLRWEGADGTDIVFQATFTLVAAEPACALTVQSAEFLENGVRVAAVGLPKKLDLVKEWKEPLFLEFRLPNGRPSIYRVLHLEVRDAAGGSYTMDWPLFQANPFLDSHDAPRQARGFDERGLP
jgi:hypothetical protein